MARWHRALILPDIALVYRDFQSVLSLLRQMERTSPPSRRPVIRAQIHQLQAAQLQYSRGLDRAAAVASRVAQTRMRQRFDATRKRTATGNRPGLRSQLVARPIRTTVPGLPTGEVGIADEVLLDRLRNPHSPGYGPYWRAQEFGTDSPEVPSQVGRRIYGWFVGKGGGGTPERPQSRYRGGGGPHPIFVSASSQRAIYGSVGFSTGAGAAGGFGGPGEIHHEIQGRHFIRDGADAARREWLLLLERNESRAIARLGAIRGLAAADIRARARPRRRP